MHTFKSVDNFSHAIHGRLVGGTAQQIDSKKDRLCINIFWLYYYSRKAARNSPNCSLGEGGVSHYSWFFNLARKNVRLMVGKT